MRRVGEIGPPGFFLLASSDCLLLKMRRQRNGTNVSEIVGSKPGDERHAGVGKLLIFDFRKAEVDDPILRNRVQCGRDAARDEAGLSCAAVEVA